MFVSSPRNFGITPEIDGRNITHRVGRSNNYPAVTTSRVLAKWKAIHRLSRKPSVPFDRISIKNKRLLPSGTETVIFCNLGKHTNIIKDLMRGNVDEIPCIFSHGVLQHDTSLRDFLINTQRR